MLYNQIRRCLIKKVLFNEISSVISIGFIVKQRLFILCTALKNKV